LSSATDVVIWRLVPDDWQQFKDVRIAALRDSPDAFSATLDDTLKRSEMEWRQGLAARTQFVATVGGEVVGTAGGIAAGSGKYAELISMWVAPGWRGRGVGGQLVGAVLGWAQSAGFGEVRLWVVEGNELAEKVYARMGFVRTGASQPVREGDPRTEVEMGRRP
jgi:GNAT superfamily N-acetyltransferase